MKSKRVNARLAPLPFACKSNNKYSIMQIFVYKLVNSKFSIIKEMADKCN